MDMTADSSRVLLQEAQSEISALRAELYATRRTAWESQQALNQAVAQRDQLEAAREQLQRRVEAFESKAVRVEPLEQANRDLQDALEQLSSRLKQADSSLAEEQTARQHFQEVYSKAEAERARLQRARDELATRILVAEQRTKEAEEEQIRAEEDAAAFQQELHALQSRLGKPDSATPGGDAVDGNAPELLRQLEAERSRSASLLMALNTAKAAATSSNADLDFARERIQQLEQALQSAQHAQHAGRPADAHAGSAARLHAAEQRVHDLEQKLQAAEATARGGAHQPGGTTPTARCSAELALAQNRIRQLEHQLQVVQAAPPNAPKLPLSGMSALSHVGREQSSAANLSSIAGSVASQDGGQAPLSAAETAQIVQKLRSQVGSLKQSRDKLLAQVDAQQMDVERLSTENQALVDSLADLRAVSTSFEAQSQASLQRCERLTELLEESARWHLTPQASASGRADQQPGHPGVADSNGEPASAGAVQPSGTGPGHPTHVDSSQAGGMVAPGVHSEHGDSSRGSPAVANGHATIPGGLETSGSAGGGAGSGLDQQEDSLAALQQALLQEQARCAALDLQVQALCVELTRATGISGDLERFALPMLNGIEGRLTQLLRMKTVRQ